MFDSGVVGIDVDVTEFSSDLEDLSNRIVAAHNYCPQINWTGMQFMYLQLREY